MSRSHLRSSVLVCCVLVFVACSVDTTGLSEKSSKGPRGNPGAAVTVVEYGDLQCPACRSAHELINKPLLEKYGQKVRFEFRHFPLSGIHEYAQEASEASECAADQGKFWEFVNMDYEHQKDLDSAALKMWAQKLRLDMDLFGRCLSSGIKEKAVSSDYSEGEKLGVNSTPTFFVNGQKIAQNDMGVISAAIDQALEQSRNVPL